MWLPGIVSESRRCSDSYCGMRRLHAMSVLQLFYRLRKESAVIRDGGAGLRGAFSRRRPDPSAAYGPIECLFRLLRVADCLRAVTRALSASRHRVCGRRR